MCVHHKDEPANAAYFKKLKEAMARQGWTLGMVSVLGRSSVPSPASAIRSKKKAKVPKARPTKTANKATQDIPDSPGVGEEAVEANRAKLRAKGITVLEEPKGRPMFQFFMARGKTKPVMTFMDSGCSDAIFREGIPAVQWEGAVSKAGPFPMGGVGGLAAQKQDEWVCCIPLVTGDFAKVRGHSMTRITSDFPQVNL